MGCRKAFDVDLVACLLDAGRPEWAEFRDHYPRCADCAAEVRTWTELQASLAPPHPSAEDLHHFEEGGSSGMSLEARQAIVAHLATCRSCRDELRALRAFDAGALPAAGPAAPTAPRPRRWPPLRRLLLHPALAYGIALAVAYPTLAPRLRPIVAEQAQRLEARWRASRPAPAARSADAEPTALPSVAPGGQVAADERRPAPAPPDGETDRAAGLAPAPPPAATLEMRQPAPEEAPATARAERKVDAGDHWPAVVLVASREVALHRPEHGLVLRLAPPRSLPAVPAGLAWMRVRDAAGRRELREQQLGNPGSNAEIRVPAAWLEPGAYRAELVLGDDSRPVVTARFRVEP